MAGVEQLERMGRELKCPICLSLLRSAVSLVCNHAFCSSCISKSMKSASNCPVCKVPYHRREIRPSPHMDNLVAIYKSMEAAAGVNIFVTQREPGNKTSDEPIHGGDGKSHVSQEAKRKCHRKEKKKSVLKNKSVNENIPEATVANPSLSMPSFPSKKRVHVTPYPISETPLKSDKLPVCGDPSFACQERELVNNVRDKSGNIATASRENFPVDQKGEPVFNPFFWLREDVDEDEASERPSTQPADGLSLQDAPCFSDIKDTDDGNPTIMTPVSKPHAERIFDSELFEWTQRPCSPELCFTPTKNQTGDENGLDKAWEKEYKTAKLDGFPGGKGILLSKSVKSSGDDLANENFDDCHSDNPRKRIAKRKQGAKLAFQRKSGKKSADATRETCIGGSLAVKNKHLETTGTSRPGNVKHQNKESSSPTGRNKKVGTSANYKLKRGKGLTNKSQDHTMAEGIEQHLPTECAEAETYNLEMNDEVVSSPKAEKDHSHPAQGRRKGNAVVQARGRKRKILFDDAISKVLEEVPQKTSNERETVFPLPNCHEIELNSGLDSLNRGSRWDVKGCTTQQKKQVTEEHRQNQTADKANFTSVTTAKVGRNDNDSGKEVNEKVEKVQLQRKKRRELKGQIKVTDQSDKLGIVEDGEKTPLPPMTSSVDRNNETTSKLQQKEDNDATRRSSMVLETLHASGDHSSKNCNNVSSHMRCAFCQSGKETEVAGDMVHYFNGKPVAAGCNGGKNVIHSHKHCAEWLL